MRLYMVAVQRVLSPKSSKDKMKVLARLLLMPNGGRDWLRALQDTSQALEEVMGALLFPDDVVEESFATSAVELCRALPQDLRTTGHGRLEVVATVLQLMKLKNDAITKEFTARVVRAKESTSRSAATKLLCIERAEVNLKQTRNIANAITAAIAMVNGATTPTLQLLHPNLRRLQKVGHRRGVKRKRDCLVVVTST